MVRDTDKVKIADEKHNKKSSKLVNQLYEELEVSSDEPQDDDFLQVFQNPWLNLTLRYLASVMVVIIAFWLYFFITSILGPGLPTYILFYPAVIIVALLAGFGPGLLATIFSVMLVGTWILPPQGQLSITSTVDQVGAVLFTGFGLLISGVSELYRRNRIKAAAYDREKALRETLREKEFLADILEHASQPFAIGHPDGRLGLLNHAFEQLTGYTKEELHSIDWSTVLTPAKWQEMEKQKLEELIITGKPVRYEKEYIRKDGSIVPIELLVNIVLDKEGKPEYYHSFITDVTERKKAEDNLKMQAALLDVSYEAIFSWDYDGSIISWNQGAERLYGFKSKEAVGSISHNLLKTKFPIEFTEYKQILIKDRIWTGELTHTTKNGREIIVESRQQLIKDASNKNVVIETNRDITERKNAEESLKISEQRISDIIESISEYIYSLDKNWNFIYVNETFARDIGYKPSELVDKNIWKTVNKLAGTELEKEFREAMDKREIRQFEWKTLYTEGYREFTAYPSSEGITVYGKDITERKKAEKHSQELLEKEQELTEELQSSNEELQSTTQELLSQTEELQFVNRELVKSSKLLSAIYELNPDAIVLTTVSDSKIIDCNQEYLNQIGYTREETIGHTSQELNLIIEVTREAYIDETRGNKKVSNIVVRGRRKDGSFIDVHYSTRQITVDNVPMILNIGHDITESKKTERKMNKAMVELERSNQELERFAYVSSHDLQEPLRMITLYTQLLERRYKDSLDSDADDFIEYIVENVKRMKQLIDDLLSFSRVNTDVKDFENVNLEAVLDSVISSLAMSIEEYNVKITHDPLPSLLADSTQMIQVFQNLIINAIKFKGEEPPEIHISAEKGEREWTFSISDNGIGIKPEHQKQIFEVFKRLHTREEYPGTGIGLSICQKIIRHHGGRIWLESEPGKGSTFYFTIPYPYKSPIPE